MSADRIFLNQAVMNLEESPEYQPYSKVVIVVGEDSDGKQIVCEAGDNSGLTLELTNPYGTDEMARNILSSLSGYQYKPFTASGAILNPAAELGDAVSVGEVYSVIADNETTFSPIMSATISAPEGSNIDHEYPYEQVADREIKRKLGGMTTQFIVQDGKIASIIEDIGSEDAEGSIKYQISKIEQTIDGITIYTEQDIQDIANVEISNWSSVNFTPKGINEVVGELYDASGAAETAYENAKDYVDTTRGEITSEFQTAISVSARQVQSTVAGSIGRYDVTAIPGYTPQSTVLFGYVSGSASTAPSAAENPNAYYVQVTNGKAWQSNGSAWVLVHNGLPTVTDQLSSRITQTANSISSEIVSRENGEAELRSLISQTANEIKATVAGSINRYDVSSLEDNPINYGYGSQNSSAAPDPTTHRNEYYVNMNNGYAWQSNGYTWVLVSNGLPVITDQLESQIAQRTDSITLSVSSGTNGKTTFTLKDGRTILDSEELFLNVDSAHVRGTITADAVAANSTITSPEIHGGRFYDSDGDSYIGIYDGNLEFWSEHTYNVPLFSIYDGVSYSDLRFYGETVLRYSDAAEKISAYGVWDFSHATVILPS